MASYTLGRPRSSSLPANLRKCDARPGKGKGGKGMQGMSCSDEMKKTEPEDESAMGPFELFAVDPLILPRVRER